MALDQTQNLVKVQVSGTHSDTDTTIQLASGEASNCPDPANGEYNMVWWNIDAASDPADDPNAEIVRVTGRDTGNDTLTVSRGQENTSASTKNESDGDYRLALGITSKMIDDIEARDLQDVSSITSDEEDQITNIDSVTITNTQWGYLGGMSAQPLEDITGESITDLPEINTAEATDGNVLRGDGTDFESTQLNHTDLDSISSGDHHTKYALTEDLSSDEISQIQNIDSVTITNTQWGYLGDMSAQPLEDLSGKTTDDLSEGSTNKYFFDHDNTNHTTNYLDDITGEPLGDLSNVSISSPSSDEVLTYDGSDWVNQEAGGGSVEPESKSSNFTASANSFYFLDDGVDVTMPGGGISDGARIELRANGATDVKADTDSTLVKDGETSVSSTISIDTIYKDFVKFGSKSPVLYVYSGSYDNEEVHKIDSNGDNVWEYTGHSGGVTSVAVDQDGYVYSGAYDDEVHKIDSNGDNVWKYTGHSGGVEAVAVDQDGYVYSGAIDNEAHKIDSEGDNVWKYTGHSGDVASVAVDSDGNVYSGAYDDEVHKIDTDGDNVWEYTGHSGGVTSVAVDSDGNVYSGESYSNDEVHKIDSEGDNVWKYTGHSNNVNAVAVDSNGNVYSGSSDDEVHKIDSEGDNVWEYTGHSDSVDAVAVYPGIFSAGHTIIEVDAWYELN